MNDVNNMLFALLRFVLCGEQLDKSLFQKLDEERLERLYKISKSHDLAHLVGAALDKADLLGESKTAGKFAKHQLMAIYRYENQKHELDRISDTLEKAKIPYIPLKGSVIRDLYPEPWMRTSCDIDVLVHEVDLDRAVAVLVEDLGYKADEKKEYHDVSLYSGSGVHLELHFNIKENIELLDSVLERVWKYATPVYEGAQRHILSKEFFVYHTLAHASYHFVGGGCGIRPFIDLWFINGTWEYDRKAVLDLCRESEIGDFFEAAEELSTVWLEGKDHSELTRRIEDYLLIGGAYGVKESYIAARQQKRGGKLGYVGSRVFVSYDHLKLKYPSLKNRAFMPFYQVKRWVDVFKEKNVRRSVRELKRNASLKREKVDEVSSLMEELNLNKHIK